MSAKRVFLFCTLLAAAILIGLGLAALIQQWIGSGWMTGFG